MNILLVEDNPGDARLVTEALRELPELLARVNVVGRVSEVRKVMESGDVPDAILLDLGLPDAKDCEAVTKVVRLAPTVPVIVLTGINDEDLGTEAVREGAQDYLVKNGLDATMLSRAIRYAIERQRAQSSERLLTEISTVLTWSMGYEEALQRLLELSAKGLGDLCIIDVLSDEGKSRRLTAMPVGGAEQSRVKICTESPSNRPQLLAMVQAGPMRLAEISAETLGSIACSEDQLAEFQKLQLRSLIAIPLLDKEKLLGLMVFGSRGRIFDAEDQALAEKIGRIAAPELANARLYCKAQEAIRARDRVLGIVAHDLRNPLNTIAISAELLLEPGFSAEQRARQILVIRRSTDRMSRLIQDLLDVARIESDQLQLHLEIRSPEQLAQESVELNTSLAASRALTLSLHCSEAHPRPVRADRDRITQVLSNLLGNAIKFTPPEGRVTLTVSTQDGATRFSVTDTGPGIPAGEQDHLFTPFWQARRFSTDGAGLGLSIAKGIVEAHGGEIGVESEVGEGTTVWFTIPNVPERRARGVVARSQAVG